MSVSDTQLAVFSRPLVTLGDFYHFMQATGRIRCKIVARILAGEEVDKPLRMGLENAHTLLQSCADGENTTELILKESDRITLKLDYELNELKKDLVYLTQGEEAFNNYLVSIHSGFAAATEAGYQALKGKNFNCFITDRDGTINNYSGRYRSSIQSVYNAVYLVRFARARTQHPIIVTSAPLQGRGLMDVSTMPPHTFVYAASLGREFVDLSGNRRHYPVESGKQMLLDEFNRLLDAIVAEPACEVFTLIGSGLQHKLGQTTIARQDISGSVPEDQSLAFRDRIRELVRELDPEGDIFRIEDTGLDMEIILTIPDEDAGLKDFDKRDAVLYLNREMSLEMEKGPHLVCGDTESDLPMLRAVTELCNHKGDLVSDPGEGMVNCVFVTRDDELAQRVRDICPQAVIVPEPDVLVAILHRLGEQS